MNELIEKLLQPVSAEQPCGPDLANDPRLVELETILKGKPEVEHGSVKREAEPPDWAQLKVRSIEFLSVCKHLRPAVMLCCSLLKVEGLSGFRDGLQFVCGLLERHWAAVHPLLDPDDNRDPQHRLNILGGLTSPRGRLNPLTQEWLAITDYLYTTPLCQPKGAPLITLEVLEAAAKSKAAAVDGQAPAGPAPATLAAQFRNTKPEEIVANYEAIGQALEAAQGIDTLLSTTLGAGGTISFENLQGVLQKMGQALSAYLPAEGRNSIVPSDSTPAAMPPAKEVGLEPAGAVRSREDVARMLERLCEYYRQCEPGSPVPYLLRRAQKLATMNFVDAMKELNLATLDQLRPSMGSAVEAAPSTAEAPPSS